MGVVMHYGNDNLNTKIDNGIHLYGRQSRFVFERTKRRKWISDSII